MTLESKVGDFSFERKDFDPLEYGNRVREVLKILSNSCDATYAELNDLLQIDALGVGSIVYDNAQPSYALGVNVSVAFGISMDYLLYGTQPETFERFVEKSKKPVAPVAQR